MFFLLKWSKKKKEKEKNVNENGSTHANSSIPVPSAAVGCQISANSKVRSPSPKSQSNVPASTNGIATHVTTFGPNAVFAGATGNAIGTNNTVNLYKSYNIRLGDKELTETQVEEFMAGLLVLPDKIEKQVSSQSSTNLPRATAAHDDYTPQKEREPCFQGTREAVLKEIGNWFLAIGTSQIYILSGLAGIGKSTIAYTVAQRADRLGLLGASFFFSRQEAERRTAEKFFTTIAFHLCVYDDEFARAIERVLATNQGKSATTKDPEIQLKVLIIEPLRDIVRSRTQPVVIVVDALDECEDQDAQVVLKALGQLVHEIPSFKVLLTTRPRPHLNHLLTSHDVFYLHNIEEKIVNNDIRSYLKFRLSTEQVKSILPTLRTPWSAADNDIDALVQAAGTLFIVASISVLFILDRAIRNPASQMKKLKSELPRNHAPFMALGDFYSIILRTVVPPDSDRVLVERFQKVVGTIVLLYDLLPVNALAHLIEIQEDDIYGVLDNMQSVILLGTDDIPYIFHKSFSDWIIDAEFCKVKDYRIDPRDGHTWLTTRCLQVLNERLRRNILNIDGAAYFMSNSQALEQKRIKEEILEKIPSVLQYACLSWARHFKGANVNDADLIDKLKVFAYEHVLHWSECMSLTMSIQVSRWFHLDLDGYTEILEQPSLVDVCEPLSDSVRFLSKFWPLIKTSALSIYHSALPFAPTEGPLYRVYKRELMNNICRVQGGPKRWDAVITSPTHGQHLDYIMFIDCHEFASCGAGSINIWHSKTGTYQRTVADSSDNAAIMQNVIYLKNMSWSADFTPIRSIAFSSNGHRLAVALSNGSVNLCGGTQIAKFDGFGSKGDSRHHLAFSPNSDTVAYRLAGGGFALRNAINGEHINDGNYNSAMVHCLVFSPDGSQLASLFVEDDHKHTLTLWDCTDGKFRGAVGDVGSELTFSADGSLIATGGWNNALKLWSRSDQDLHFIETPHLSSLESVSCLAFSQDGILAVGSANTGIILYDVAKRSFITAIPFPKPTTIAFSSDCSRLAIGNKDGDLRLLDVLTIKASAQTSQQNSAPINALIFSPDCSRLVSGSEDGIIRIWDTSCASESIATREGHSSKITTIAFTPNGGRLASGDANGTIKLWSSDDCALSDTIQWPISGELTSVAVSSYLLVAATKDSIALWDLQRSCIIDHLGDCGSMLLSLSNQDENVLLASFDGDSNSVTVWDVGNRKPSATFTIGLKIERMVFSPDDSHLFVHDSGSEEFYIFDILNKVLQNGVLIGSDAIDQGVVPSWKGIPVWMRCSNNHCSIRGRFSESDGSYTYETVCQLPGDLDVVKAAYGSRMFALLCKNGCLVLLQSN